MLNYGSLNFAPCKDVERSLKEIESGVTPTSWGGTNVVVRYEMKAYTQVRKAGMYALVAMDWVEILADKIRGRSVLEIMAGRGWLTKALRECGIEVVATDNMSWWESANPVTDVTVMDASEAVRTYNADVLLVSWPPMDVDISPLLAEWEGAVVEIGEGPGGCTGSEEMFDVLDEKFTIYDSMTIPRWEYINDTLVMWRRR